MVEEAHLACLVREGLRGALGRLGPREKLGRMEAPANKVKLESGA